MKNFIKGLVVGVATLSTVVGITMATTTEVKAEELGPKNTAVLTKELQIPNGVIVPETTFKFTVTPKGVESGGGTLDETRKDECLTWEIDDITFSSSEKATSDNKIVKSTDVWSKISDLKFAAPGIYYYEIAETQPGSVGDITYSKAEYTVRILVENTDDGLKVTGIIVDRLKDDDGNPVTGKVDPAPKPDDGNHSEFRFINKYRGLTKIQVKKIVAGDGSGDFGDREKDFAFTITLNLPETVSADFDEVVYSKKNVKSEEVANEKVTITNRTGETQISLKHGETIEFTKLPVGSTYTVVEKIETNYTPTAKVTGLGTNTGDNATSDKVEGNTFTVTVDSTDKLFVQAEGKKNSTDTEEIENATIVTNTFKSPSITGVITDNLPFVLMVAVAGAGIVFLTISKRRRAQ